MASTEGVFSTLWFVAVISKSEKCADNLIIVVEFIIDAKNCGGEREELSARVNGARVDVRVAIQEQRGERKDCSRDERRSGD